MLINHCLRLINNFYLTMDIVIPLIVALLFVWLLYRLRRNMPVLIRNEIYAEFPFIKESVGDFQSKIEYFSSRIEELEHRIKELEEKKR